MRRNRSHLVLAAALMGLTLTSTAEAQGRMRPRDPAAGSPGPQAGVMRRGGVQGGPEDAQRGPRQPRGNAAAMLLRLRGPLALTDDQVKRLETLAAAGTPKANASDMLRARADLMDAMQGDGNLNGARAAFDKMSRLRTDRMIAGLKQRQEARAILTAAQKSTLDNMRQDRRGRGERGRRALRGRAGPDGVPSAAPGAGRRPQGLVGPGARRGDESSDF